MRVLQDRGDNPQSLGRVGGESGEPGCENGKLEWGLFAEDPRAASFLPTPILSHLPLPIEPSQFQRGGSHGVIALASKKVP